jgi:hypothetical protein
MDIAHIPEQRAGKLTQVGKAPDLEDLTAALETPGLQGGLAHERDCLAFMMTGWPSYEGTKAEECFSRSDLLLQIEDVRRADVHGELEMVVDAIEHHAMLTGPTVQ